MKDASGKSKKKYLKNTSLDVATQDYDIKKGISYLRYFIILRYSICKLLIKLENFKHSKWN